MACPNWHIVIFPFLVYWTLLTGITRTTAYGLVSDTSSPPVDIQLTGGTTPNEGRLEVRLPNTTEWQGICRDSFYPLYATIICHQLSWYSACDTLTTSERSGGPPSPGDGILTLDAQCLGSEYRLWECDNVVFIDASQSCKAGDDVWLVCLKEATDLEIRLSGGEIEGEGYVEMRCPDQKWSTVCTQDWDIRDANIVCQELDYPWAYSTTPQAQPGVSLGERVFGQVLCIGNELSMAECQFTTGAKCGTAPAGVQCGVEFNHQSTNIPVHLCGGHHCSHESSNSPVSDPSQHCRCDCQCTMFKDCCYDFANQNLPCSDSESFWKGVDKTLYECSPVPGSEIHHTAYVLITKCPVSVVDATERSLCESDRHFNDVIGFLPVFDSQGIVYKNIFCAVCHGLTVQDVTQWGIRLNHDPSNVAAGGYVNPALIIALSGSIIGFEVVPSGLASGTRRCPYNVVDKCPVDVINGYLHTLCSSTYYAPVTFDNVLYRNPHCAICNGVELPDSQYCTECPKECPRDAFLPCYDVSCPGLDFETQDVTFSLDAFFEGFYGRVEQISCAIGEVYDPFLRQCINVPCAWCVAVAGVTEARAQVTVGVSTPSQTTTTTTKLPESVSTRATTALPEVPGVASVTRPDTRSMNVSTTKSPSTTTGYTTKNTPTTISESMPLTTVEIKTMKTVDPTLYCFLREIEFSDAFLNIEDVVISRLSDSFGDISQDCLDSVPLSLSIIFKDYSNAYPIFRALNDAASANNSKDLGLCASCNITNVNLFLNKQLDAISDKLRTQCTMFLEPESTLYPDLMNDESDRRLLLLGMYNLSNANNASEVPAECVEESKLTCVTTTIEFMDYQIIDAERTVWLNEYNITLAREEYAFQADGSVKVCSSLMLIPWSLRSIFEFAVVACIGLSVAALIILFFIYLVSAGLRDVAGKCLLNMIVAFVFGLTLSVVHEFFLFHPIACISAAAVGHFAWLGAFGWLVLFASVIALGVDYDDSGYLFCKMFVVGWAMPGIAIGICFWIHLCQCLNVELSYGGEGHCWLEGQEALQFSLVVPILVLLVVSIAALICGALRVRKVREFVTAYSEEITEFTVTDVIFYIVLCLLLFLPWSLAIADLLLNIEILNDIHRITYALQGVFIFAAIFSTERVRGLCKQKQRPVEEDTPIGVTRQLSKRIDAPDGASNRVWLKRNDGTTDGDMHLVHGGSASGDNTWL